MKRHTVNEATLLRIADTYGVPVSSIQRQLGRLEANSVLVSREIDAARVFEFNLRNPTVKNLRTFLTAELDAMPEDETLAFGDTVVNESDAVVVETPFGPLRVITPTQRVMDRLAH